MRDVGKYLVARRVTKPHHFKSCSAGPVYFLFDHPTMDSTDTHSYTKVCLLFLHSMSIASYHTSQKELLINKTFFFF